MPELTESEALKRTDEQRHADDQQCDSEIHFVPANCPFILGLFRI